MIACPRCGAGTDGYLGGCSCKTEPVPQAGEETGAAASHDMARAAAPHQTPDPVVTRTGAASMAGGGEAPPQPPPAHAERYIRPSRWPLGEICPSSLMDDGGDIDSPSDARTVGIANHRLCRRMVEGEAVDATAVRQVAEAYQVDPLELSELFSGAQEAWAALRPHFGEPRAEVDLPSGGRCDVLDLAPRAECTLIVLDWKKRWAPNTRAQIIRYAHAAALETTGKVLVKGIAVFCETGTYEVFDFTAADFDAMDETEANVRQAIGKTFNPGDHCSTCPRRFRCDKRLEGPRAAMLVLLGERQALTPEKAAALYRQIKPIEEMMAAFKSWLLGELQATHEAIPLGNGKELYAQEQTVRSAHPRAAWKALKAAGFDDEMMERITKVSVTKAIELERARATGPRGSKQKAEDALIELLGSYDAIRESTRQKLGTRKVRTT